MHVKIFALALLTLSMVTCGRQSAFATLLGYEGFDYETDSTLGEQTGGFGWNTAWTYAGTGAQGLFVALADSLDSPAYPIDTTGGALRVDGNVDAGGGNTRHIDRFLETPVSLTEDGAFYASVLFRKGLSDPSNPAAGNNMELDLLSATGGTVVRGGSTSNDQWFLNVAAEASGAVTIDETYFLVLRVEASSEADPHRSMIVFDSSQTVPTDEPETWDFDRQPFASTAALGGVRLWIGLRAAGVFDELRVGTTWESVTVSEIEFPGGPSLVGDFNGDGFVDGADLAIWTANYGLQEGATVSAGDANGDGVVDGTDFLVWQQNLSGSGAASAVPEPHGGVLAATALLTAARWKRRRGARAS